MPAVSLVNPSGAIANAAPDTVGSPYSESYTGSLSPGTQGLIASQGQQATDPNAGKAYVNTIMNGVNQTGEGLLRSPAQTNQNTQSLGMQTPDDYSKTLGTRTAQNYKSTVDALNTAAKQNAPMYQMDLLGKQAGNLADVENLRLANYKLANQQYEQQVKLAIAQEQANNATLGSVLGLVGLGIGAAIAGIAIPGVGAAAVLGAASVGGAVGTAAGKAAASH